MLPRIEAHVHVGVFTAAFHSGSIKASQRGLTASKRRPPRSWSQG